MVVQETSVTCDANIFSPKMSTGHGLLGMGMYYKHVELGQGLKKWQKRDNFDIKWQCAKGKNTQKDATKQGQELQKHQLTVECSG